MECLSEQDVFLYLNQPGKPTFDLAHVGQGRRSFKQFCILTVVVSGRFYFGLNCLVASRNPAAFQASLR